jgi:type II secretory pathway pseudopilin PulG
VILRDERGVNLIEVLMVMTVATLVLGASVMTFTKMLRQSHMDDRRNQSAETARNALDVEARQVRNLAQRISNPVIDKVDAYDFIFQTSDPTRTWVRYCLDTPPGADQGRLWESAWAVPASNPSADPTAAMATGCPGSGWTASRIVAENIVNRTRGADRPVFSFSCTGGGTACAASASTYDQIIAVGSELFVDTTPAIEPPELKVATAVYLRNQNQAPVAKFDVTSAGSRTVILNASGSTDFEGRTLSLYWFKGTIPAPANVRCDQPTTSLSGATTMQWGGVLIGQGATLTHTFSAADGASGANSQIALLACDPGGRFTYDGPRGVTIPS